MTSVGWQDTVGDAASHPDVLLWVCGERSEGSGLCATTNGTSSRSRKDKAIVVWKTCGRGRCSCALFGNIRRLNQVETNVRLVCFSSCSAKYALTDLLDQESHLELLASIYWSFPFPFDDVASITKMGSAPLYCVAHWNWLTWQSRPEKLI